MMSYTQRSERSLEVVIAASPEIGSYYIARHHSLSTSLEPFLEPMPMTIRGARAS
jgi:hypothetical protein